MKTKPNNKVEEIAQKTFGEKVCDETGDCVYILGGGVAISANTIEDMLTSSYEQGVRDERIEQNEEIRKIVKQFQYLATDKWHKGAYEKIGNEALNALKTINHIKL